MENPSDIDRMETLDRLAIQKLYGARGIVPFPPSSEFCPGCLSECNRLARLRNVPFNTGTWPYIGAEYGKARVGGRNIKVLFVAMERGGTFQPAKEPTFAHTQMMFHERAITRGNAHMGGTSQIVEHLVGHKQAEKYSHQFALTNAVKCVKATGRQKSTSTGVMKKKCSEHLWEELQTLQPDLVITQGIHPRKRLLDLYSSLTLAWPFPDFGCQAEVFVEGAPFILLTTPHPANKPWWPWKNGPLPVFLQKAVECASRCVSERHTPNDLRLA